MKPAMAFPGRGALLWALGLLWAAAGIPAGQAVPKLGMAPYVAAVEQASAADRLQIVSILSAVASAHGLKKEAVPPPILALFTSPPSGLGLAMSARDEQGNGTIDITVGPVDLGIRRNKERQAVMDAVDAGLRRVFGARLKK